MRLLVIQPRVLFPANDGGRLYSANLWGQVAKGHDVTMLVPRRPQDAEQDVESMKQLCSRSVMVPWRETPSSGPRFLWSLFLAAASSTPFTVSKYHSKELVARCRALLGREKFDLLVADRLPSMGNVPGETPCPVAFIDHNVESVVFARFAQVEQRRTARWYLGLQAKRLKRFERAACARADLCVALSEHDLDALREQGGVRRGAVVSPGVDLDFFQPADRPPIPHRIVFTGSMDSWQNVNCVNWFAAEVLPLVQNELPDASLAVVGRNPRPSVRRLEEKCRNLIVTGQVDDVRPYIAEAEVFVIPLRFGSGVRLKTFEALAMGKAVVSTAVGVEGTTFVDGEHLLLADAPQDMAAAILRLMREPDTRRKIERAGREHVVRHYSWRSVAARMEHAMEGLLAGSDHHADP